MKISIMKKLLVIIDREEINGYHKKAFIQKVYDITVVDHPNQDKKQIEDFFTTLEECNLFKSTPRGLDLSPSATIIARSPLQSISESLAFFEIICQNSCNLPALLEYLKINNFQSLSNFMKCVNVQDFFTLAIQSNLFITRDHLFKINPRVVDYCKQIVIEYIDEEPLLTTTLKAVFAADLVDVRDHINFRNQYNHMIEYIHKEYILKVLPYVGIPESRDDTKTLQAFYKDTLFNEFNHSCALCGIELPAMLIASHIKPFRDCAHIYEAIDHNNGLLLCRNHDYLFDQGYISFSKDGTILLSQLLQNTIEYENKYVVSKDTTLDSSLLTDERIKFLEYHTKHIYKK